MLRSSSASCASQSGTHFNNSPQQTSQLSQPSLARRFVLGAPACAQFAAILLRFCLVAKVSEQATQHKALLSSRTDKHRRSACLRRIHCVDNLGVPGGNMRVRSAIKKLCDSCKVVKRRGKLYIVCKASPKVCVKPQLTFR